jgi:hypothetical protein
MTHTEYIRQLLDRYWEGETSLDEERTLKQYFKNGEVDPQLLEFVPLFKAIQTEQAVEWSKSNAIRPVQPRRYNWAIAAAFLVLLSAGAIWWSRHAPEPLPPAVAKVNQRPSSDKLEQTAPAPLSTERPELADAPALKVKNWKPRRPHALTVAATIQKQEAETAKKEILEAFSLLSSKLKKGRSEADKGLREVERMDIIKRKPTEG